MEYRIYLADDDPDDREMFKEALNAPLTVTTFENGEKMLLNLMNDHINLPDIIFLDLNMPKMDGEECLSRIKEVTSLCAIPIVLYSDSLDTKNINKLLRSGANRCFKKPSTFRSLQPALWRCIEAVMEKERLKKSRTVVAEKKPQNQGENAEIGQSCPPTIGLQVARFNSRPKNSYENY